MKTVFIVNVHPSYIDIKEIEREPHMDEDIGSWLYCGSQEDSLISETLNGAKTALKEKIREQVAHYHEAAKRYGLGEL